MGTGDCDDRIDLVREQDRPLERLHPAKGTAGHRREPPDPQLVEEGTLNSHHIRHGDHGKSRAVRLAGSRVDRRRPGSPAAPAEEVGGDHKEPVGVERLPRADHPVPPPERLGRQAVALLCGEPVAGAFLGWCH